MTFAATRLIGHLEPTAVFDGLAADLLARGMLTTAQQGAARAAVEAGQLPASALVDVGAPAAQVLQALSVVSGVPAAPPADSWDLDVRARLGVSAATWSALVAVPVGVLSGRPLVAFAEVQHLTSSAALTLPDHVPCVALERDVRAALARATDPGARPLAFLAPPSAVVQGMDAVAVGFSAGSSPGLAGTLAGPAPATPPPSALQQQFRPRPPPAPHAAWTPSSSSASPFARPSSTPHGALSPALPFSVPDGAPVGTHVISDTFEPAAPGSGPAPWVGVRVGTAAPIGPGARIGNYIVDRRLGEGGMATVYVASRMGGDPARPGTDAVAIKVVHEHLLRASTGGELRRRFQREVAAMRTLDHPGIVACIDAGQHGESEYLVSEFMRGGSLAAVLGRSGKLPPILALAWFVDLLEALAHAHRRGVVHRDLKPDNLLLDVEGRLKIADFGIARLAEGTQLTAAGGIVGTPSYMSPEQALASPVDQRADLYAAGLILYESIVGRNPFTDTTVMAVLKNVVSNKVRPLGEVEPAVPALLDIVVGRLLSLRADDRYATADEVLAALDPLLVRARAARDGWRAVVAQEPKAVERARDREADAHAATARAALAAGQRMVAGHAAFRGVSLSPDHRGAREVLTALNAGSPPVHFARSSGRALLDREDKVDRLEGEARRRELRALAQVFFDEGNPLFSAHYGRRAVAAYGVQDEELADLARVLPLEEIEDLRSLPSRAPVHAPAAVASPTTTVVEPWRPAAVREAVRADGASPLSPDAMLRLEGGPGAATGAVASDTASAERADAIRGPSQISAPRPSGGDAAPAQPDARAPRRLGAVVAAALALLGVGLLVWQWVSAP